MNWFERHLNWTWMLGFVLCALILIIASIILIIIDNGASFDIIWIVLIALPLVIMLPLTLWVLNKKGRDLVWFLLGSFLSPLWLSNKKNSETKAI